MAANAKNRKAARHLIGTGLTAKLVGSGLPCKTVFDYRGNWEGQAPCLMVLTVSSDRAERFLGTGNLNSDFVFNLTWIVPDQDSAAGYTSAMSDDTLDDIEKLVSDWVADNNKSAEWSDLHRIKGQPSSVDDFVKGKPYKSESLLIQCKPVYDV